MSWGKLEDQHGTRPTLPGRIWEDFIEENYEEIRRVAKRCLENRDICEEVIKVGKMTFMTPLDMILYMKRRASRQREFKELKIDGVIAGQWWVKKLESLCDEAKSQDPRIIKPDDLLKQVVFMQWYIKAMCNIIDTNDVAPLPDVEY